MENKSPDLALGRADVRIRLRNAAGTLLTFRDDAKSEPATEAVHSAWMRPNERIGVGNYAYLEPAPDGKLPDAVSVEATIDGSWFTWCALTMQRVRAENVETTRDGSNAVVRFIPDVPASCSVSRLTDDFAKLQAIYYDRGGDIVGGDALAIKEDETRNDLTGQPARVTATAHLPAKAEPRSTEVYAMGGCGGRTPSGAPK